MTIEVDRPGIKVCPTLYGRFFEEVNHAGDGGLYAEMIRNRSFEDTDKPEFWSLVSSGGGKEGFLILFCAQDDANLT